MMMYFLDIPSSTLKYASFCQGGDDSSGSDTEVDDAEFLQSKIEREFYDANNEDQTNNDDVS